MKDSEKFITAVKGRAQGLSFGSLAKRLGVPKSTIRGWLALAAELGLTYARLRLLSQKELQELLARKSPQRSSNKYEPRWEDFVIKAESPGDKGSLYRIYKDSCPSGVAPMSRSAFYRELFKMKEVLGLCSVNRISPVATQKSTERWGFLIPDKIGVSSLANVQ